MNAFSIHVGRVEDVTPTLDGPFDAVLCDPPYGLGFRGKEWDRGVPPAEVWAEVARLLRPGANLAAFGGTRTFHLLAAAIERAGLVIRDCLSWLYGSGFSKPYKLDGAFTGYANALKPAWEPCVLAMRPLEGTYARNARDHGVAGLNVDGGRIPSGPDHAAKCASVVGLASNRSGHTLGAYSAERSNSYHEAGRWPANLAMDEGVAAMVDGQVDDGPSRFFYVAKVSAAERNAGMDASDPCRHPTLKPVRLIEWLAKLLLPPPRVDGAPRRLLVPFSGAGSEIAGALRAGWDEVVGIEQSAEYSAWAERRVPALVHLDFEAPRSSSPADLPGQGLLFEEVSA